MVVQSDELSSNDENSNESYTATYDDDDELQTSPLDLSTTSTQFKFVHRSKSTNDPPPSPMDFSANDSPIVSRQTSRDFLYNEPFIVTQPKSEWHYRSIKDLAKKHIPFISGEGPQRTPIRIKVPEESAQQMYLGIAVVTRDKKFHDSKVIVPAKTTVNIDHLSHDNNLNCLVFDQCNPTDYFHPVTKYVYLPITTREHRAQLKEVRIHMFNLYQNQTITKEIIETKQLDSCRLAFWLCTFENERYTDISSTSYSCIIQEKKMTSRSGPSQRMNNQMTSILPYLMKHIEYFKQDNTNSDKLPFFIPTINSS